ncbi:MAG TPA: hypothetical protein VHC69_18020, partial [Polyangiaceae bacterium]|nr:hypothetical protein [Polyangiaceae bacterium]
PAPRRRAAALGVASAAFITGCAPASPPAPASATPAQPSNVRAAASVEAPDGVSIPGAASAPAGADPRGVEALAATGLQKPEATPLAESHPAGAFPPPSVAPPFTKTALSGDGVWTPFGSAALGERAVTGPFVVRTVLHPHPDSRYVTVTIAAVDLSRVTMHLVPGTEDMLWAKRPESEPSGLVPAEDRDRLIAVMNGGFQPKHGHWGLVAGAISITPPRDEGCTLALYRDGAVRLGPWPELAPSRANMESIRQTPPCLLDDGALHPALSHGDDKRWAGHAADLTTRRRSAVGLDASGRVLFYAMGEEASPRWLAEGLRLAGAASAAELDINWYWTRFLLFGAPNGEPLQVTSTLIPKMEHLKRGYVERPSTRDFFYFVERR